MKYMLLMMMVHIHPLFLLLVLLLFLLLLLLLIILLLLLLLLHLLLLLPKTGTCDWYLVLSGSVKITSATVDGAVPAPQSKKTCYCSYISCSYS